MKVLVPHDGSVISDRALKKAIEFASKLNYEIILLHIIDLKLVQSESIVRYVREKQGLLRAKAELLKYLKMGSESMLKAKIEDAKKVGVRISFTLGIGSTSEGIVKVARTEKVDFIIMGSRGLSSERSQSNKLRVLGSIANRVSELADCPVMIVK